jgi:hypothetical protein
MSNFPTELDNGVRELPLERLGETGRQAAASLAEKGFKVVSGLTPEYLQPITAMAREPAMREYTPKDLAERFTNLDAARRWQSKGRLMFLLLKEEGNVVAGYGWAGPGTSNKVPYGQTTFAVRIGQAGQGQGLAAPFSQLIILGSAVICGAEDYWLETWQSNGAAVHTYHKIGFKDVASEASSRITAQGENISDTRLFMDLDNSVLPS